MGLSGPASAAGAQFLQELLKPSRLNGVKLWWSRAVRCVRLEERGSAGGANTGLVLSSSSSSLLGYSSSASRLRRRGFVTAAGSSPSTVLVPQALVSVWLRLPRKPRFQCRMKQCMVVSDHFVSSLITLHITTVLASPGAPSTS